MRYLTLTLLLLALYTSVSAAEYPHVYVKKTCEGARDPSHCRKVALSIATAESSKCKNAIGNNCWGFRNKRYESPQKAFDVWFKSYNKFWHKAKDGTFFYGPHKKGTSFYCTSEYSSNTIGWCPVGKKHFNSVFFSK